ncbi:MAG: 1-acyl-sn-glycerol-3-phosphate acyltransferase [Bacteroidales bacterium]|nr:1-acyl-sn-glycerol-3-phosphate acyltransferase [Bacteroidales bacterium]
MDKFKSIRPYNDSEVDEVLTKHKSSKVFLKLINHIYPSWTLDTIARKANKIHSLSDFHNLLIFPALKAAIDRSMDSFTVSGLENIKKDGNYLFISNHRDIVIDSTILYYVLFQNGYKTGETAIGSNLLVNELVTDIVKLNQNFIVSRNLPTREMIVKSRELSEYIRLVLELKMKSVWISHREGRTKDGNDKTNPGVLKMIAMDCTDAKIDYLLGLKIVPISLSYEFDSCDALKAKELAEIELTGEYKKDGSEDMKSIITGVTQQKGKVHLAIGKPITKDDLAFETDRVQDHFKELADQIDYQIHQNFKLFPGNFVAYDILNDTNKYDGRYDSIEKERFLSHLNDILNNNANIEGFETFKRILLGIYANPVVNQLEK